MTLLLDEVDKIKPRSELFMLLNLLEGNEIHKIVKKVEYHIKLKLRVFATCNDVSRLPAAFVSRFQRSQENFEIIGRYFNTVDVPINGEDSKPIVFNLKPIREGSQTIKIEFFQYGTYIGQLKLPTLVVTKTHEEQRQLSIGTKFAKEIPRRPDVTLYIYQKKSAIR